jgi:nitrite reductase/ring-hydroxylating ferredoxin subunit
MAEVFVAKASSMKDGDRLIVRGARGEIGVIRHANAFHAYSNVCAHSGGPACEGLLMPQVVDLIDENREYQGQTFDENRMHFVCPWHGWEYDLKTGVCIGDPRLKLKKYDVVRRGDDLYVID